MEHNYLHTFRLVVEGLPEPVTFHMYHEAPDESEVTDAFSKWVARQEDDFIPLGATSAVRANRVLHITHVGSEKKS